MNLQDYFDVYMELLQNRETTMRIGQALEQLSKLPKNAPIQISMEWLEPYKKFYDTFDDRKYAEEKKHEYDGKQMYFDKSFDSDRGDYANMYLGFTYEETKTTVQDLIDLLNTAKEQGEMVGYKGGIFPINDNTLLTIAEYGFSEGIRPTYFELKDNVVIMHTIYKS